MARRNIKHKEKDDTGVRMREVWLPWEEKNTKFIFSDKSMVIEEARTPWDLLIESRYTRNHALSNELHQLSVKAGIERIFSIRILPMRMPLCSIITRPVNARIINPYWIPFRALHTDSPMTIDGQQLIVLGFMWDSKEGTGFMRQKVEEFFLARGGVLDEQYPLGITHTTRKEIENWRELCRGMTTIEMICSDNEVLPTTKLDHPVWVKSPEEALVLLGLHTWDKMFLDKQTPWTEDLKQYVKDHLYYQPIKTISFNEAQS